jgi:DNA-binding transcriptional LysR family regulator
MLSRRSATFFSTSSCACRTLCCASMISAGSVRATAQGLPQNPYPAHGRSFCRSTESHTAGACSEAALARAAPNRGRPPGEILLTAVGRRLLDPLLAGFDQIEGELETFEAHRARRRPLLRISTMAPFAATWLVPRLGRFTAAHPWIDVSLQTTPDLVAVGRGPGCVEVAIRHGLGNYSGLESVRLLQPRLVPVGSPGLLATASIRSPADCFASPCFRTLRAWTGPCGCELWA